MITAAEHRALAARNMTERDLQAQIVELAKAYGWTVYHTHDSRRSEPGFPDLTLVRNGHLIFAELKTEKGKTSEAQDKWLTELREAETTSRRVRVYLWRPVSLLSGEIAEALR